MEKLGNKVATDATVTKTAKSTKKVFFNKEDIESKENSNDCIRVVSSIFNKNNSIPIFTYFLDVYQRCILNRNINNDPTMIELNRHAQNVSGLHHNFIIEPKIHINPDSYHFHYCLVRDNIFDNRKRVRKALEYLN